MESFQPLVSVILVSYNHAQFVADALASVLAQNYTPIELILVDDASEDDTLSYAIEFLNAQNYDGALILPNRQRLGNCAAFNRGFWQSKGEFIIDLAADDLLLPSRVAEQVAAFRSLPTDYAVVFSDAWLIDEQGRKLRTFYPRNKDGSLVKPVKSGNIYLELLAKQYLSSPTMMMRRSVLVKLLGYDESLSYEDYDFWLRSAREHRYFFQDKLLTAKRVLKKSHKAGFWQLRSNPHLESTLKVCLKAQKLNQTPAEDRALAVSVRYHLRLSVHTENFTTARMFARLLGALQPLSLRDQLYCWLAKRKIRLGWLYLRYLALRGWLGL